MTLRTQAGRGWRPWIASIAAYLFVLQTLLAAVAVTQAAAASATDLPTILCAEHTTPAGTNPDQPAKAALCEHCVVCAVAAVTPPVPDGAALVALRFGAAATAASITAPSSIPAWRIGLRTSQGPPQIA